MIMISRGLKGRRVLKKLKIIHQFRQNQSDVRFILASMKDVPTKLSVEEYVADMVPKLRLAVMKDVPILLSREECVRDTERRGKLAVMKDVPA